MGQEKEKVEVYEIENKKYTVISRNVNEEENIDLLYNVLCKYALSKIK